jgi:hypothetical protein
MRFTREGLRPILPFSSPKTCLAPAALVLGLLLAGCGSNPSGSSPVSGGVTTVAIQISSAANDQLTQFTMGIQSITLTNQAGKSTTIFNTPTNVDFIPANGGAYPLATVQVPQDVYTSAAVTVLGPAFIYTFVDSTGSIDIDHALYSNTQGTPVVTLPASITIAGNAMGLNLSLDVSKSLTLTNPAQPPLSSYTGTPTFDLTAFPVTAEATTPLNGKCIGLAGQLTAASTSAVTVTLTGDGSIGPGSGLPFGGYATGGSFTAAVNSGTQFQGVASAAGLAAGSFVNVDLALEPDGSYTASRVEVQDTSTTNITAGTVLQSNPSNSNLGALTTQYQGSQLESSDLGDTLNFVYAGSTKFQTSARFSNFTALPFTPVFNASTLVAGQVTSIGAGSYPTTGGAYALPTTVTLLPQTIDANITAVSTSGSYTVYTVQLAPYDPIAQLNGPITGTTDLLLTNANIVHVYVSSSTTMLNATPIAAGGTFRFNGLLFDDGGALRLVAGQVNDGVAF